MFLPKRISFINILLSRIFWNDLLFLMGLTKNLGVRALLLYVKTKPRQSSEVLVLIFSNL
jgi:hypothetical protein